MREQEVAWLQGREPAVEPDELGSRPPNDADDTRGDEPVGSTAVEPRGAGEAGRDRMAKYRTFLVVGVVVLIIGVVAIALIGGASAARYECESLLTPAPEPSTAAVAGPVASAAPTQLLGFATRDLGRTHVSPNQTVRYAFCPPASGDHWSIGGGRAPLNRQFYRIGDDVSPGNWIHNLEHGYVVIAYRDELTAEEEAGIREVFETADQAPSAVRCGIPNKVIVVPFADMDQPFTLLAWDRVLPMAEWDTETGARRSRTNGRRTRNLPKPTTC